MDFMEKLGNSIALDKGFDKEVNIIIEYLNKKTGRQYKVENIKSKLLITKLLRHGYSVEDFKRVINNKVSQWNGTNMETYLRPNTLFSIMHFDEYLNEPVKEKVVTPMYELDIEVREINDEYNDIINKLKRIPYEKYLCTDHWKMFKSEAVKNAKYSCQLCGGSKTELNVHHKTYETRGRETFNDVIVLCKECHAKFHDK